MKRNIKFRGKRIDTGEWVHGYYAIHHISLTDINRKTNQEIRVGTKTVHSIFNDEKKNVSGYWKDVIPETIGQFTGLYDKNGKEIYEGDVVSGLEYEDFGFGKDGSVDSIVEWRNDTCSFELVAVNGLRMSLSDGLDIEVIGNIHDNIELLNEK